MSASLFTEEDVVHRYTRAEALEDGVLVDVSEIAREAGVRFPVAVSRRVWVEVVEPPEEARATGQSEAGRLWDVLWCFAAAARRTRASELVYEVLVNDGDGARKVVLKAVCGPGDTLQPVMTILFPEED